jgi:hypothetical protein
MPDPQVQADSMWSQAGQAIARAMKMWRGPSTDGSGRNPGPAFGYAVPNDKPPALSDKFEQAAREQLAKAVHEDMAHAAAQIDALLKIDDPEHFKAKLEQLQAKWKQITGNTLLAPASADALEKIVGTSFANGLQPGGKAVANAFDPDQPRDEQGRWTNDGGSSNIGKGHAQSKDSQRSETTGGALESAKNHVGGGAETSPGHDASRAERLARVATEQERLTHWARQNNRLVADKSEPHFGGREHDVILHPDSGRVTKYTRTDHQLGYGHAFHEDLPGATPGEYLDRPHRSSRESLKHPKKAGKPESEGVTQESNLFHTFKGKQLVANNFPTNVLMRQLPHLPDIV